VLPRVQRYFARLADEARKEVGKVKVE
jgi:hypothetical protein